MHLQFRGRYEKATKPLVDSTTWDVNTRDSVMQTNLYKSMKLAEKATEQTVLTARIAPQLIKLWHKKQNTFIGDTLTHTCSHQWLSLIHI